MDFSNRLKFYLLGFILGLFLIFKGDLRVYGQKRAAERRAKKEFFSKYADCKGSMFKMKCIKALEAEK